MDGWKHHTKLALYCAILLYAAGCWRAVVAAGELASCSVAVSRKFDYNLNARCNRTETSTKWDFNLTLPVTGRLKPRALRIEISGSVRISSLV